MANWLKYVESKTATAVALSEGQCGGSYSDACILLSAILSGIAAELWPGKGIDKKRFVQSWIQFSDAVLSPNLTSVPLLAERLRSDGRATDAQTLENTRPKMFGIGYQTVILCGPDVDQTEDEVISSVKSLTFRQVRRFSYPALFYEHVRSSLSHEWKLSPSAASVPMTRRPSTVSYVNRVVDRTNMTIARRLIHFDVDWLVRVTRSIAKNSADMIESSKALATPPVWWLDGK